MKRVLVLFFLLLIIPCFALGELTIYFLDVGQGDSAIIECDGEVMIIDGGLPGKSDKIYAFLEEHQLNNIKYMIATHPDRDHIGGLPAVLQKANVQYIYSPVKEYPSEEFSNLLNYARQKRSKIKVPYERDVIYLGNASITFMNCGNEKKNIAKNLGDKIIALFHHNEPEENPENNDMSLVLRIDYGDTSYLFTGDIQHDAEKRLLGSGVELKADVLKVAHHGSDGSSLDSFLDKVNPQYAIISCGKGNAYKHPSSSTLRLLSNTELYRTDLQGDITCTSDGKNITFKTEKQAQSDCYSAPQ